MSVIARRWRSVFQKKRGWRYGKHRDSTSSPRILQSRKDEYKPLSHNVVTDFAVCLPKYYNEKRSGDSRLYSVMSLPLIHMLRYLIYKVYFYWTCNLYRLSLEMLDFVKIKNVLSKWILSIYVRTNLIYRYNMHTKLGKPNCLSRDIKVALKGVSIIIH